MRRGVGIEGEKKGKRRGKEGGGVVRAGFSLVNEVCHSIFFISNKKAMLFKYRQDARKCVKGGRGAKIRT